MIATTVDMNDVIDVIRLAGRERIAAMAADVDRTQQFSPELWKLLCDLGVPGLAFPESDGGAGGSFTAFVTGIEEIATAGAIAALYPGPTVQVASAIRRFGTDGQWRKWGMDLVQGRAMAAWAFTEPGTGSDPKQITTRAERYTDGWVLNGAKMFTSFAQYADVALVYARTSADRLGAFLVDTAHPGWQPGTPIKMMAFGGQGTSAVAIDDVTVPDDAVLGEPDAGFDIMVDTEAEGKIRASAICVGIGRRALLEATRYASQRLHRGAPLGEKFPTVQGLLGDMSAHVDAARAMVATAAAAVDLGERSGVARLAASARIVCSRMAREVTSSAMQVCGAYGFTQDMVLERLYREGKFYEVGQGVVELQRIIAGKERIREYARTGDLSVK